MKKYSLSDYILSFTSNDSIIDNIFGSVSIGGEGSYLGSITIGGLPNLWDTTSFATGGWVHNKNLSRTGTVNITLNQLSDAVAKFIQLCNTYYTGDFDGLTLSLTDRNGQLVAECIDCYIQKIPDQSFNESSSDQTWTFTSGKISFL